MSSVCSDCAVRDIALCSVLSDVELERLNSIGRRQKVAKGDTIQWAGDESLVYANIISGVVKLSTGTADGREQIVGLLYPADSLGRLFAVEVDYDATALTDAELCIFPRSGFERTLEAFPVLERQLLQRTLSELENTRRWMLLLGRKTAEEKVASFLLNITSRLKPTDCPGANPNARTYLLPLTRGQIADVLGLTIETVSRQMTKLKTAGVIALPDAKSVTILDTEQLEDLAEAA